MKLSVIFFALIAVFSSCNNEGVPTSSSSTSPEKSPADSATIVVPDTSHKAALQDSSSKMTTTPAGNVTWQSAVQQKYPGCKVKESAPLLTVLCRPAMSLIPGFKEMNPKEWEVYVKSLQEDPLFKVEIINGIRGKDYRFYWGKSNLLAQGQRLKKARLYDNQPSLTGAIKPGDSRQKVLEKLFGTSLPEDQDKYETIRFEEGAFKLDFQFWNGKLQMMEIINP